MLNELANVRLRDLEIFAEVARAQSIREVARRISCTSGQVSKAVQNLEKRLGAKLFTRSVSGVLLTSHGSELQKIVADLLESGEKIESLSQSRSKTKSQKVLAIAGTSFLNTHFATPVICAATSSFPQTSFRFLDLPPDQLVPVGLRGGFDLAVHFGALAWPSTWTSKQIGKTVWKLCAKSKHKLGTRASLRQVLEYPFVVPTYWTPEGLARGSDQFPVPMSKRKVGFETATAEAAVSIILETDQIAFLPQILVKPFIQRELVREILGDEIPVVEKSVYLSAKSDVVPASAFAQLSEKMSQALS